MLHSYNLFLFLSLLSLEVFPSCLLSLGAGFSCHTAYSERAWHLSLPSAALECFLAVS